LLTTAFTVSQGFLFRPPSKLGSPVPPPKHPMLKVRRSIEHAILPRLR
jgi:hypothetical protein